MKRVSSKARIGVASVLLVSATLTGALAAQDGKRAGGSYHKHHHGGGAAILSKFVETDTNNDNRLSVEELLVLHQDRFERMDADQDGSITRDEMTTFVLKRLEDHPKADKARFREKASNRLTDRFFYRLDLDDDGKVTVAEQETQFSKRFALADRNSDTFLDVSEIERAPGILERFHFEMNLL